MLWMRNDRFLLDERWESTEITDVTGVPVERQFPNERIKGSLNVSFEVHKLFEKLLPITRDKLI